MKKIMTVTAMLVFAISMFAKDIKTVVFTTLPQMHCENCENKIKGNLRFEKGIKQITTSVPDQKLLSNMMPTRLLQRTSPRALPRLATRQLL